MLNTTSRGRGGGRAVITSAARLLIFAGRRDGGLGPRLGKRSNDHCFEGPPQLSGLLLRRVFRFPKGLAVPSSEVRDQSRLHFLGVLPMSQLQVQQGLRGQEDLGQPRN
jgi:hypothetical protein